MSKDIAARIAACWDKAKQSINLLRGPSAEVAILKGASKNLEALCRELAADLEAKAAEIMRENPAGPEAQLDWCRRYAAIVTELGIPCTGYASWADWVADVESDLVVT